MVRALPVIGLVILFSLGRGMCGVPEAPVYTNQDLERRFGPPSPLSNRPAGYDADGWAPVVEFLDRQYARIDADRRNDLDRRASDREDRVVDAAWTRREPYVYGWYSFGGFSPYSWGGGVWIDSSWSGYGGYGRHGGYGGYGSYGARAGGQGDHRGEGRQDHRSRGYASSHAASAHVNAMRHRAFLDERPTLGQPGRHPLAPSPGHGRGPR